MEWRESRLLSIAYLQRQGDEKFKAVLYDDRLVLSFKNKRMNYELKDLQGLSLGRRKWLFPLIFGGILLPLLLVGLFTAPVKPQYFLMMLFPASLLFYYGWEGQAVLTVLQGGKEIDLPLKNPGYSLEAFVDFINAYILSLKPGKKMERFYFVDKQGIHAERTRAYSFRQYRRLINKGVMNGQDFLAIDPLLLQAQVEYSFDGQIGEMRPVILGQIGLQAIENL